MTGANLTRCRFVGRRKFHRIHRRNLAHARGGFAANTELTADAFKYRRLTGDTHTSLAKLVRSPDRAESFWLNFPRFSLLTQIASVVHDLP